MLSLGPGGAARGTVPLGVALIGALGALVAGCGSGAAVPAPPGAPRVGAPASVVAVSGADQTGRVGDPVPLPPTVRVLDAAGEPVPGVTVGFSVTAGGGSVSAAGGAGPVEVTTDRRGEAAPSAWTLGPTAGLANQVLRAEVPGLPAVVFSATAASGPPARIAVVAGDGQSGRVTASVPVAPAVVVTDRFGNPVPGAAVVFTPGDGYATPDRVETDAGGRATTSWVLGPGAGDQRLVAAVPEDSALEVVFRATGDGTATLCSFGEPAPAFGIDVCPVGELDPTAAAAVEAAVTRWEAVIVGDLPDTEPDPAHASCTEEAPWIQGRVDDLVLYVEVARIDGPGGGLAGAAPCFVRGGGGLPSVARLRIDGADVAPLDAAGRLVDVLTHEIGHALGFGTLWPTSGLLRNAAADAPAGPPPDTHFDGPEAVAAYAALGGPTRSSPVPVQNTGGQGIADLHWRESILGPELMTATLDEGEPNLLSAVTVASLADLGYVVDMSAADDYVISSPAAGSPVSGSGPHRRNR